MTPEITPESRPNLTVKEMGVIGPKSLRASNKNRHSLNRAIGLDSLSSRILPARIHIRPKASGRKVYSPFTLPRIEYGRGEIAPAKHIFVLDSPARRILWELVEQRAYNGGTFFVGLCHQAPRVRAQFLADCQIALAYFVRLLSIAPNLVTRPGKASRRTHLWLLGLAVAV